MPSDPLRDMARHLAELTTHVVTLERSLRQYIVSLANNTPVPVATGTVLTTDATVTTLYTYALPAGTTTMLEARVVARRTGGAAGTAEDGAAYIVWGAYKNAAGTATLIGSVSQIFVAESQAGWDATLTVSGGNVLVRVTGAVNNNVSWSGYVFAQGIAA